jgi:hypothetical protein
MLATLPSARPGHAQDDKGGASWNYATLSAITDYSCLLRHWRIVGVCVCIRMGKPIISIRVRNPYPTLVLESSRQDYQSAIAEVNAALALLKPTAGAVSDELLKTRRNTSSHTSGPQGGRSTQFAEARVMEFAPPVNLVATGLPVALPCTEAKPLSLLYVSELDAFGWRHEFLDALFYVAMTAGVPCDVQWAGNLQGCAGPWGSYYPRVGWATHSSSVITAYVQSLRAARVATEPAMGRVVLSRGAYPPRTGHYIQLVEPKPGACRTIGTPDVLGVELGNGSSSGRFIFIVFGVFERCIGCEPCGQLAAAQHP